MPHQLPSEVVITNNLLLDNIFVKTEAKMPPFLIPRHERLQKGEDKS